MHFWEPLSSSTLTGTAGTIGGRVLAANLLKLIPGVGTIAGGFITGGIAGTITTTFGEAYIATLYSLTRDNPERELSAEEIGDAFQRHLKRASLPPQISS